MIEGGWLPDSGGMAGIASRSFSSSMLIILLMATHTGHRGALELAIDVTQGTRNGNMRASQLEGRKVMVKAGGLPRG